jgi:formamidopyrimidine-DNA glycosylase
MPELPEVETIRRGLSEEILGEVIESVAIKRYDLRKPIPATFDKRLTGQRVRAIGRRGKYLLLSLSDDLIVIIHLGMSGRMVIGRGKEPVRHDHVVFRFGGGLEVKFNDPRRFGSMDITTGGRLAVHPAIRNLGVEPLTSEFTEELLAQRLLGRRAPIKNLLMNQTIVAGLGNIYVCESLFLAGISPRRAGSNIKGLRLKRLVESIRTVLTSAIHAGGSSLRDYVQASGELGYFQHHFNVYNKEGQPCVTGYPGHLISRLVQANRSTFFCSLCQR